MKESATKVIFRMFNNEPIALFPEELGTIDPYTCSSYAHIGQHSSATLDLIIDRSRPATESEYADLKAELEAIGYELAVCKKTSQAMLRTRIAAIESLKALSA